MEQFENVDVQREVLGEKIEIVGITLAVLKDQIDSLEARIDLLQRLNQ